ncbi:hypothetical protein [Providencia rettgeri]|nr:hypothetical protein [Providencia rettgeri]
MASEEILEVTRIGRADGQWGCNGHLVVSTTAKYSRIMFDQGEE